MIGTSIGNSLIWDNGTNVGIGNTGTTYKLEVTGTGKYSSTLLVGGNLTVNGTYSSFTGDVQTGANLYIVESTNGQINAQVTSTTATIQTNYTTTNIPLILRSYGNSNQLYLATSGNVGIGTSSPTSKVTITDTGVYGSALNLSEGGLGAWVQGSTEGLTHAFIGNFKYNFTTPSSSFSYYSGTGYGIDMCDGIRFFSAQSNVTNGTFTPTERMRITNQGALMVATSSGPNVKGIFIGGTNSSYINLYSNYSGGAAGMNITNSADVLKVEFYGSTGNYYFAGSNISDRRAKSNIQEITEGLSKISLLKPSTFTYDKNPDIVKGGFIAQEVEEVIPEFVTIPEDENEMMGVDYFGILALAVKAIQEMNTKLDEQNQTIQNLQEQINILAK